MEIQFNDTIATKVNATELQICAKCSDCFSASLHDADGKEICNQEQDYVPKFMPGDHYGDYVMLTIDIETGVIKNWEKPSADELAEWVEKCRKG